jgi:hypothetical protein
MSNFYNDVKSPIYAGKAQAKFKKVGYKITRLYYDTADKDCLIGEKIIKYVIN